MAYNTVPFHGKKARIEKNGTAVEWTNGWNLNIQVDTDPGKSRQGQDWKEYLAGQAGGSGSMSGAFVAGNTEQKALFDNIVSATPGTALEDVKFLLDASTNAFEGDIIITGLAVPASIGGTVTWTINFIFDGAVILTDAA